MQNKKIPSPDWKLWKQHTKLTCLEAASLSINFCPKEIEKISREIESSDSSEFFSLVAAGFGMDFDDASKYLDRLNVLKRNYDDPISTSNLRIFATNVDGGIPPEFADLVAGKPEASSLPEGERDTLLKQIAWLSLILAEKDKKYTRGKKPNFSEIAKSVNRLCDEFDISKIDIDKVGTSRASLSANISAGLKRITK